MHYSLAFVLFWFQFKLVVYLEGKQVLFRDTRYQHLYLVHASIISFLIRNWNVIFTHATCNIFYCYGILMSYVSLQNSWNRDTVSLTLAYAPPFYWLTHTDFMPWFLTLLQTQVLGFDSQFLHSRPFIWNIFSRLYFSCFSELCSVFRLRSVRLHNDSANLRKPISCHSSSSLTKLPITFRNLSRVGISYTLISLKLFILWRNAQWKSIFDRIFLSYLGKN